MGEERKRGKRGKGGKDNLLRLLDHIFDNILPCAASNILLPFPLRMIKLVILCRLKKEMMRERERETLRNFSKFFIHENLSELVCNQKAENNKCLRRWGRK